MGAMQKLAGLMRRAIEKYDMIQPNDRIAVGVSGGKDSVALLVGLCKLREYIGIPYEVVAITMDPCFGGVETDYTPIAQLCEQLGVPYVLKRTEIGQIIFDVLQPKATHAACVQGCAEVVCTMLPRRTTAIKSRWDTTTTMPLKPLS